MTLTSDWVKGEPGPNVFLIGEPRDFLDLVVVLHPLGLRDAIPICLNNLPFVMKSSSCQITCIASPTGTDLTRITGSSVVIDLKPQYWHEVLHKLLSISWESSFNYIEFDDHPEFREDANLIVESTVSRERIKVG